MTPPDALISLLGDAPRDMRALSGGDLSAVFAITMADGRRCIAKQAGNVGAEAAMLARMAQTGVRVPAILACSGEWMVLAHVDGNGRLDGDAWDGLARQLCLLHTPVDEPFGWPVDHGFGKVAIPNGRGEDWARFWADNRLRTHVPHVDGDLAARVERLCARIDGILPPRPAVSLLHGDLWGGNVMVGADGAIAALIDPASYFGHREVDWAMLTVFNTPPDRFFAQMEPDKGWRERLGCYRLWPLLVHLRLFGASYRAAVEGELTALGV